MMKEEIGGLERVLLLKSCNIKPQPRKRKGMYFSEILF